MSFFDFFRWSNKDDHNASNIKFGRYSDGFNVDVKYNILATAIDLFDQGERQKSVVCFLDFLRNDLEDNVKFEEEGDEIFFELQQGSKKIIGRCNSEKFVAISDIAHVSKSNVALFRRLLDKNYILKFCRFCLNEESNLILKFDSHMADASPRKLFKALKELAINSDKYDDILIDEFAELSKINTGLIVDIDKDIVFLKEAFIRHEITETLDKIAKIPITTDQDIHAISYMLLYCNYKLDFLTKPEGFMMEIFEKNHRLFFSKNNTDIPLKNLSLSQNLASILKRSKEEISRELYDTIHTFGYTQSANHAHLVSFIQSELEKVNGYLLNKQTNFADAVLGYIAAYSLFHYAYPQPDVDLLLLVLEIYENTYFNELGLLNEFITEGMLSKKNIENRINQIKKINSLSYPEFRPNLDILNYNSATSFSFSVYTMMSQYNLHYSGNIN